MCGRFVSTNSAEEIASFFGASSYDGQTEAELPFNFNVAPTDDVLTVLTDRAGQLAVQPLRWGLIPSWAKDVKIGASMINARAETLVEKAAFKNALAKHRCIIPMAGFYEWKQLAADGPRDHKGKVIKQPMFIRRVDGEILAAAGVWSAWRDRSGPNDAPWLRSCSVITTKANPTMEPIHDRMPAILEADGWRRWLDPHNSDIDELRALLAPASEAVLTMHPVSTQVNSVRNNGAELIEPVDPSTTVRPGPQTGGYTPADLVQGPPTLF